jgi:ABC transporter with metal-binding/Fe-S-binding domain ATP-binding protein
MKLGILYSGGKDSTFAAWLAKKEGYNIACLITLISSNKESYMFHTPSINQTEVQAKSIGLPLIVKKTSGAKETELKDLEAAIKRAKKEHGIQGIVTGAVESVYQASRVQKICNNLGLECFNPLWQKDQMELLQGLLNAKFDMIVTGVFAWPLNEKWIGRKIDRKFLKEVREFQEKYKINPAGEGGEFETFVLNAPGFFKRPLKIKDKRIYGEKNSWRMELEVAQ